jgi:hypothetical protein
MTTAARKLKRDPFKPTIQPLITRKEQEEEEEDVEAPRLVEQSYKFPEEELKTFSEWQEALHVGEVIPSARSLSSIDENEPMPLKDFISIFNDTDTRRMVPPLKYIYEENNDGSSSIIVYIEGKPISTASIPAVTPADWGPKLTWLKMERKTLLDWFQTILPGRAKYFTNLEDLFDLDSGTLQRYQMTPEDAYDTPVSLKTFLDLYNDVSTSRITKPLAYKEYSDSITIRGFELPTKPAEPEPVMVASSGVVVKNVLTFYTVGKSKQWQTGPRYKNLSELKIASDLLKSKSGATQIVLAHYSINTTRFDDPSERAQVEKDRYYTGEIYWQAEFKIAYFRITAGGNINAFDKYLHFTGTETELVEQGLPSIADAIKNKPTKPTKPSKPTILAAIKTASKKEGVITIHPRTTKKTVADWETFLFGKKTILEFGRKIDKDRAKDGSLISWEVFLNMIAAAKKLENNKTLYTYRAMKSGMVNFYPSKSRATKEKKMESCREEGPCSREDWKNEVRCKNAKGEEFKCWNIAGDFVWRTVQWLPGQKWTKKQKEKEEEEEESESDEEESESESDEESDEDE